jgi:hypothetical protein
MNTSREKSVQRPKKGPPSTTLALEEELVYREFGNHAGLVYYCCGALPTSLTSFLARGDFFDLLAHLLGTGQADPSPLEAFETLQLRLGVVS